jgi:hypothetical protein
MGDSASNHKQRQQQAKQNDRKRQQAAKDRAALARKLQGSS